MTELFSNQPPSDKPILADYPKLYCPFVRQVFKINKSDWENKGRPLGLRGPEVYLAVNRIHPEHEWVFNDPDTIAVEKLNGTNVKIFTQQGRLIAVQNRKNVIDPLQVMKGKTFLIEGIFMSIQKGYVKEDGEQDGEVIGPKLQGNPYQLEIHEWYPFEKAINDLRYKSFHEHERNFDNWSLWFKDYLFSRYHTKRASKLGLKTQVMAEGVVFYNLKRRAENKAWRAKLRRDMFPWFYDGIEIFDYESKGRDEIEDQEQFD